MNKLRLFIPMSALALTVLFTNCVDNTESEGVKAMRTAQAELISAKAEAEKLKAEADAALAAAQLEVEAAKAANLILLNKKVELENEKIAIANSIAALELKLQEETNEAQIARLKMQIELEEAKHAAALAQQEAYLITAKAAIETAQMNAEVAVKQAEQDMIEALAKIAAARDAASKENQETLDILRAEYRVLLDDIVTAKTDIINKTTELAKMDLNENLDIVSQRSAIEANIADNNNNTLLAKEWLAKYEAINTANDNEGLYVAALSEIASLENEKNVISEELPAAEAKKTEAKSALDDASEAITARTEDLSDAYNAYWWAYTWQDKVKKLNDEDNVYMFSLTSFDDIDGESVDFVKMFDKELDSYISNLLFIYSKKEYEDIISDVNTSDEDRAKAIKARDFTLQITSYLNSQSKLSDFSAAHKTAKDELAAAKENYVLATEAHDIASDEVEAINKRVSDVSEKITYTETYADALKTTKEALDKLIEDEKEAISDLEEELAELENDLLVVDLDEVDWNAKKVVKEQEIANLQAKLVDLEGDAATVKAEIDELLK